MPGETGKFGRAPAFNDQGVIIASTSVSVVGGGGARGQDPKTQSLLPLPLSLGAVQFAAIRRGIQGLGFSPLGGLASVPSSQAIVRWLVCAGITSQWGSAPPSLPPAGLFLGTSHTIGL